MNKDLVEFLYGCGLCLTGVGIGSILGLTAAGALALMLFGLVIAAVGTYGALVNHVAETKDKP